MHPGPRGAEHGADTTCGRGRDGGARCVGTGRYGAFGDGTWRTYDTDWEWDGAEGERAPRTGTVAGPAFAAVALSDGADPGGCGTTASGEVWCWGAAGHPLADRGRDGDPARPARVDGLPPVVEVAPGDDVACARTAAGAVWCWGDAEDDRLVGDGRIGAEVGLPAPASALAAGGSATCAIAGREVWCWGWNVAHREDDDQDPLHSGIPGRLGVAGAPEVLGIGHFHGCAAAGAKTRCFGDDVLGALGGPARDLDAADGWAWPAPPPPAPEPAPEPRLDADAAGLLGILGGDDRPPEGLWGSVLGDGAGTLDAGFGLGSGLSGLLGTDGLGTGGLGAEAQVVERRGPQVAEQPLAARSLSIGGLGSCGVDRGGELRCWGRAGAEAPQTVASGAVQVSVGEELACVVRRDGGVDCWTLDRGPTPVEGVRDAVEVAVGHDHACARLASGRVACWGDDRSGQLGRGVSVVSPAPVRVPFPEGAR